MRSSAVRLTLAAVAWLSLGVAAFLVVQSERSISSRRSTLRAFDQHARELSDVLARARVAQQAYVAEGQGSGFWMPELAKLVESATTGLSNLREGAIGPDTGAAIDEARTQLDAFGEVDRRAREYLNGGQMLMAADVIFTEGGGAVANAGRQVQEAADAEHRAADQFEASQRRLEGIALAGAAGLSALILTALALVRPRDPAASDGAAEGSAILAIGGPASAAATEAAIALRPAEPLPLEDDPALGEAAGICTDLGRISHPDALPAILARAADTMGASSLILWMGDTAGAELKPAVAHGYNAQALGRMRAIPRLADNAIAAAYRTGTVQTVASRAIGSPGAIITPLLTQAGCVGALTAEVPIGVETSERAQALSSLYAAQLATILGPTESGANPAKTATA